MLSYDEALQSVLETVRPLDPVLLSLTEAVGLVLAEPVKACWDMPMADNSGMDGFAIAGVPLDLQAPLKIIGTCYAGHPFSGMVDSGQAVRITTGAPLPTGADTVVPVEETEEHADQLLLCALPVAEQHVRCRGEEYRAGELLLDAGTQLLAGEVGLLASAGVSHVMVYPRSRVAVLSTGDELVELGEEPGPGQIVNSNLYQLTARLLECGCEVIRLGIGRDDPADLDALMADGFEADLLLTTGGVSVGDKDHVQETLLQRGFEKKFWKVAIKPGKPLLFGTLAGKPVFGLPGNPAATAATFELFVRPALRCLAGFADVVPIRRSGVLANDVKGGGKRQAFLWCRLDWQGDRYRIVVTNRQGSGQNRSLQGANALLAVPVGVERMAAGETVEVLPLRE
jgi:molybdopterin molybdotransferase